MSLHLPSRGALQAATAALRQNPSSQSTLLCARFERLALSNASQYTAQRRTLFGWGKSKAKDSKKEAFDVSSVGAREKMVERLTGGPKLSKSSIFADEDAEATDGDKGSGKKRAAPSDDGPSPLREHQLRARDPDPRSRVRWQRKRVIRLVSRNLSPYTRESRAERIARTERELTHKGDELPISTKKLMMLARQISGKTVEDAIVQMRFSKKKAAQDLKVELEVARDRAVVERGMGLGRVTGERFQEGRTAKIQTKDKKWLEIDDPTRLYIDQAWVNKGAKRSMSLDYRARGRAHRLTHPTSRINLVLKEEKSRMRAHKEREQKKASRGPWLHLPNRPVTAQRPFYSW